MLLPPLLGESRLHQPFVLLQSTAAQSILPVVRALCKRPSTHTIIYTLLYAPCSFLDQGFPEVEVRDWSAQVPGYSGPRDISAELSSAIRDAPKDKPLDIVIDSLETLSENLASPMQTYLLLRGVLQLMGSHPKNSQLIVHSMKQSETALLLLQTDFSSSLVHLTAHPTSLFRYLSREYMICPPPVTPDIKFWSVFISFSERMDEVEHLSFGPQGEGGANDTEIVVEILTRGTNNQSRKRGADRVLEGWDSITGQPCAISDLQGLKLLFSQKPVAEPPDPIQNLPFKLSLSESQQQSRAQVPLPYVHEGQCSDTMTSSVGAIFYDPDSADDIDDDDPDDDLDI